MRHIVSKAWHDPVWSKVIATLITAGVIAVLASTSDVAHSSLAWLWMNVMTEVWGAYLLVAALGAYVLAKRRGDDPVDTREDEPADVEYGEIARQVAEKEIVKYAQATKHQQEIAALKRRLQEVEYDHERLKAEKYLSDGCYQEGTLLHALKMVSIGNARNDSHKIDAGMDCIRRLLSADVSFSAYQIREAASVLEDLPSRFDGASLSEEIASRRM